MNGPPVLGNVNAAIPFIGKLNVSLLVRRIQARLQNRARLVVDQRFHALSLVVPQLSILSSVQVDAVRLGISRRCVGDADNKGRAANETEKEGGEGAVPGESRAWWS